MVSVWKWIQEQITTHFNDAAVQESIANYQHIKGAKNICKGIEHFAALKNMRADKQSRLTDFFKKIETLFANVDNSIEAQIQLANNFGIKTGGYKATINVVDAFRKTRQLYPLLFTVVEQIGYDDTVLKKALRHLEKYVALIIGCRRRF